MSTKQFFDIRTVGKSHDLWTRDEKAPKWYLLLSLVSKKIITFGESYKVKEELEVWRAEVV